MNHFNPATDPEAVSVDATVHTAMTNTILSSGRLPVRFPALPPLVQTMIEDYFKNHLPMPCDSCKSPQYVRFRYLNNKSTSRTLQPRYVCYNPICNDGDGITKRSAIGGSGQLRKLVHHFTFNVYRRQMQPRQQKKLKKTAHALSATPANRNKTKRSSNKDSFGKNRKIAAPTWAAAEPNFDVVNAPSSYNNYYSFSGNYCYGPGPTISAACSAPPSGDSNGGGSMLQHAQMQQHLDYQMQEPQTIEYVDGEGGGFFGGAPTSVVQWSTDLSTTVNSGGGSTLQQMHYLDYQMIEYVDGEGGSFFGGAPTSVVSTDLSTGFEPSNCSSDSGSKLQQMQYLDYQMQMIEFGGGFLGAPTSVDLTDFTPANSASCGSGDGSMLQQMQYLDYQSQQPLIIESEGGGAGGSPTSVGSEPGSIDFTSANLVPSSRSFSCNESEVQQMQCLGYQSQPALMIEFEGGAPTSGILTADFDRRPTSVAVQINPTSDAGTTLSDFDKFDLEDILGDSTLVMGDMELLPELETSTSSHLDIESLLF